MILNEKIQEALNKQINAEMYSSYLYFAMAAYLESQNLHGMSKWMFKQGVEELGHAQKLYNYIHERSGRVFLEAIEKPPTEWKDARTVFEEGLKHEAYITHRINELVELAEAEKDYPTLNFLQWYVNEQVEEEATFEAILEKFDILKNHPGGLYIIDRELGSR